MPTTSKGYNGSTDFEEWYKQMYKKNYDGQTGLVRGEGMSDGDWNVGTVLYNRYIQGVSDEAARQKTADTINERYNNLVDTARVDYDSSRTTLGDNKKVAQQNASVIYDKMCHYLPQQAKANGLSGLGTAGTQLKAYNTYMSKLGEIASDYNRGMAEIDSAEKSHIGELENYRTSALAENDELYDGIARERDTAADSDARTAWSNYLAADKAAKDEAYEYAHDFIGSHTSEDAAQILSDLEAKFKGRVTDEAYTSLSSLAEEKAKSNKIAAEAAALDKAANESMKSYYDSEKADAAYESMTEYINGGNYSAEELQSLYNEIEVNLTSAQKTDLLKTINNQAQAEKDADRALKNAEKVNAKVMGGRNIVGGCQIAVPGKGLMYANTSNVSDSSVIAMSEYIPENTLFGYGGAVYFRSGTDVYKIDTSDKGWNNIKLLLNMTGGTSQR